MLIRLAKPWFSGCVEAVQVPVQLEAKIDRRDRRRIDRVPAEPAAALDAGARRERVRVHRRRGGEEVPRLAEELASVEERDGAGFHVPRRTREIIEAPRPGNGVPKCCRRVWTAPRAALQKEPVRRPTLLSSTSARSCRLLQQFENAVRRVGDAAMDEVRPAGLSEAHRRAYALRDSGLLVRRDVQSRRPPIVAFAPCESARSDAGCENATSVATRERTRDRPCDQSVARHRWRDRRSRRRRT